MKEKLILEISNAMADILSVEQIAKLTGVLLKTISKYTITEGESDAPPLESSNETLLKLFRQIANRGGEGVSRGCELVISKDGQLVSARLHGKEIDPKADYRVVTIDYLLGGNDGMSALNEGHDVTLHQDSSCNTRFILMDYFKEKAAKGEEVDAKVEGRIKVVE